MTRYKQLMRLARDVRKQIGITYGARCLFTDICELAVEHGHCRATPKYFADDERGYGVDARTIRRWINELIGAGVLRRGSKNGQYALFPLGYEAYAEAPSKTQESQKGTDVSPSVGQNSPTRTDVSEAPIPADLDRTELSAPLGQNGPTQSIIYNPDREEEVEATTGEGKPDAGTSTPTPLTLLRAAFPDIHTNDFLRQQLARKVTDLELWSTVLVIGSEWNRPTLGNLLSRYENERMHQRHNLETLGQKNETRMEREMRETIEVYKRMGYYDRPANGQQVMN